MTRIAWKTRTPKYGPERYEGYTGNAHVFDIAPSLVIRGDYKLTCSLPGYKNHFDKSGSVEEMKTFAEQIFEKWLIFTNLEKRTEE